MAGKNSQRSFPSVGSSTIGRSFGTLGSIVPLSEVIKNIPIRDKTTAKIFLLPKYRYTIAKVLHGSVDICDRRYHFKTYKNCFIATSLVDVCVDLFQIVRDEAVQMIKFIEEDGFIQHVSNKMNVFKDEFLFFKFTPRFYQHIKRRNSISGTESSSPSFQSFKNSGQQKQTNLSSEKDLKRQFSFSGPGGGGFHLTRIDTSVPGSSISPRTSTQSNPVLMTMADIRDKASKRKAGSSRSNMDGLFSHSPRTSIGSGSQGSVTATATISLPGFASLTATGTLSDSDSTPSKISITEFLHDIPSEQKPIENQIHDNLSSDFDDIESVEKVDSAKNLFSTDPSLNLQPGIDNDLQPKSPLRTHSSRGPITHGSYLSLETILSDTASADRIRSQIDSDQRLFLPNPSDLPIKSKTGRIALDAETARSTALLLFTHVDIDDRRYLLKLYESVFIGSEAVDTLCTLFDVSRKDATQIASLLMQEDLIHHCTFEHNFEDGSLFYAFSESFYFTFNIPMPVALSSQSQTTTSQISKMKRKKTIWEICSSGQVSKLAKLFSQSKSGSMSGSIISDINFSLRSSTNSDIFSSKSDFSQESGPDDEQIEISGEGSEKRSNSNRSATSSPDPEMSTTLGESPESSGPFPQGLASPLPFSVPNHPQLNALNTEGHTPLLCAIISKSEGCVSLLCRQFDINLSMPSSSTGLTPLMTASQLGYNVIVDLLLSAGANPLEKSSHDGSTALHWAAWNGHNDIIVLLGAFILDVSVEELSKASSMQLKSQLDPDQSELFTKFLDTQSKSGSTALHWAASQGFTQSVCLLLDWGANPLLQNSHAETPGMVAERREFTVIANKIREAEQQKRKELQTDYVTKQINRLKSLSIVEWNSTDVAFFVDHLGFPSVSSSFQNNQITGNHFVELTKSDLVELGFTTFSYRATFIRAVQDYFPEFCCPDSVLLGRQIQKLQLQLEDMRNQMTILNERVRLLMEK